MARINPKLLEAIYDKSGLKKAAVYARLKKIAGTNLLPNDLAAIKLAAEFHVPIGRFATAEQLQHLRAAGEPVAPPSASAPEPVRAGRVAPRSARAKGITKRSTTPNCVMVVHGRDLTARRDMFDFIRALGIRPIEWSEALNLTRKPSPYVGEVLDAAFKKARAVVVLLTPDDMVELRSGLRKRDDPAYERRLTGKARPNVLFEAGMAFATHPAQTVLVELGDVRKFSDIGGRHVVKMDGSPQKRDELATKLENAGCDVNRSGTDWYSAGTFADPLAGLVKRIARKKKKS